jgi:phosphoenolpyruvate synthase/pyruvate phosphate dikinase
MNSIIRLDSEHAKTKNMSIGGKAINLIKVNHFPNIQVPVGFVIPVEVFEKNFDGGSLSEKLTSEILNNYDELFGKSKVAVRSSAILEDSTDKSFAGQYESILNVSKKNVIDSIVAVHFSKPKMKEYSVSDEDSKKTAVIVQKMIQADFSGILFTKNPMNDLEAIIEYDTSYADKLASGTSSGKEKIIINREQFISHDKMEINSINYALFNELFSIGFKLEKELNHYCDIEWAVKNSNIYILQVRPITTLGVLETFYGEEKEFDAWTKGNVREVLPEKMTPLSWSIFGETINQLLRDSFKFLPSRYEADSTCFIQLQGNRLLYNIGAVNHFTNDILGFPTMNSVIGGNHIGNSDKIDNLRINWKKVFLNLSTVFKNNNMYTKLSKISKEKCHYIEEVAREYEEKNYTALSIRELIDEYNSLISIIKELMFLHTFATSASFSYVNLLNLLLDNCNIEKEVGIDLLSNIDGIKIFELNKRIVELTNNIKRKKLQEYVLNFLQKDNWKEELANHNMNEISEEISSILDEFGHRGSSELELSIPTWKEKPDLILSSIANYLINDNEVVDKRNDSYTKASNIFGKNMRKKKLLYPIAKNMLGKAREYTRLRENNKHYLYLLIAQLRRIVNELKNRIPIEYEKYFYMLTFEELKEFLLKKVDIDLQQLRIRKKILQANYSQINKIGNFQINSLKGIVASAGYVKGRVRILESINEIDLLEENDILVTKTIDIGWLPTFQKIGGLITEIGGVLSHGSIIAREFGLPTIVNVENVSSILQDGEEVIVDANKGIVYRTT